MNHCLFKAKDTKGAVGNTVDYSSLTIKLIKKPAHTKNVCIISATSLYTLALFLLVPSIKQIFLTVKFIWNNLFLQPNIMKSMQKI